MFSLSIQYHQGAPGLTQIYDPWLSLIDQLPRPHFNQHPEWYAAYFEALQPTTDKLTFCSIFNGSTLVAVLPVMQPAAESTQRNRIVQSMVRRATLAKDQGLYTTDLILSKEADAAQVWRFMRKAMRHGPVKWDVFHASDVVPGDYGLANALRDEDFWVVPKSTPGCRILKVLPHTQMIAELKKRFRYNLRRSGKLLEELGTVTFTWHESNPMDTPFQTFLDLEQAGWKGRQGAIKDGYPAPAAIALEAWKTEFYRQVVRRFAEVGALRLLILDLNGTTIGAQLTIHLGKSEYLLKTAMNESVGSGISIGHLMVELLIKRIEEDNNARNRQIDELNFLTDYDWPKPWGTIEFPHTTYRAYNTTPAGILAALASRIKN